MDIVMVGTGSILTAYLSSCAVIDSKIMIDCPNGSIKKLRYLNIKPDEIDIMLISHFHADHFWDIPFFLMENGWLHTREKPLNIIGPKDLSNRLDTLINLAYPKNWDKIKKQSKLKITEIIGDELEISFDNYIIKCLKVDHGLYDSYGFMISKDLKVVGFTGDTLICDNVKKMAKDCELLFVDMNFAKPAKGDHMCLSDIEYLMKEKKAKIIPTHMTDEARELFSSKYFLAPEDGAVFTI